MQQMRELEYHREKPSVNINRSNNCILFFISRSLPLASLILMLLSTDAGFSLPYIYRKRTRHSPRRVGFTKTKRYPY